MWHLAKDPLEHQAMVAFNTPVKVRPRPVAAVSTRPPSVCHGKPTTFCDIVLLIGIPYQTLRMLIFSLPYTPHTPYCPAPLHSAWHPAHPLRKRFWVSSSSRPSSEMPKCQGLGFSLRDCSSEAPGFALWPVSPSLRSPLCLLFYARLSRPHPPYLLSYTELLGSQWLSPWWEAIVCETHRDSRHAKVLPCPACGIIVFSGRANLLARYRSQLCNFYKGNTKGLSGWRIL